MLICNPKNPGVKQALILYYSFNSGSSPLMITSQLDVGKQNRELSKEQRYHRQNSESMQCMGSYSPLTSTPVMN